MGETSEELHVAILRRLQAEPQASQRELARATGVSLGKLNYALRALIEKGWVKVGNFSRNPDKLGYAYLLTPRGIEAKARLTRQFLARKMREYDQLRSEIERLQREVAAAEEDPPPGRQG
ncbi:MarR family EPS-associated transcriptional regulator [Thermomonas haemolytica]|uniref:EPS-associated MarR family transcriptional regulator n=1 Tax=Thermomonas haemolytica TaxID=141949 RepID=A0A4R3N0D6_9GAMM|nr:MarR family EPS-associated transcriptional regulator [Thermomonas haemolytica]TCT22468.1 EPS-associated MarR family transcriptional regulator [Thermomonas haemolytica]TNY29278.1 MarR family EPS-associated transcriptional regulator [Thermomonas haemolytica]